MHNYITWEWALSDTKTVAFEFAVMNAKRYNITESNIDVVIHCFSFAFYYCGIAFSYWYYVTRNKISVAQSEYI